MGVHLLVGLYRESSPLRAAELRTCLARNLAHDALVRVHGFVEDVEDAAHIESLRRDDLLGHAKMTLVPHGRRVAFGDLFDYAARALPGEDVVIANADICFDESLRRLEGVDLAGRMLALSRWDLEHDGGLRLFAAPYSQDAWIFRAPLPAGIDASWCLGVPGCDSRLAAEAERVGLLVSNPAFDVRAVHLHQSAVRRYTARDRLAGAHRYVPLGSLEDVPAPLTSPPPDFPWGTAAAMVGTVALWGLFA